MDIKIIINTLKIIGVVYHSLNTLLKKNEMKKPPIKSIVQNIVRFITIPPLAIYLLTKDLSNIT